MSRQLLRNALAHLDDLAYLQLHPLARSIGREREAGQSNAGQSLRQQLLDAIARLSSPEATLPGRDAAARSSAVLQLRYLRRQPVVQVCTTLGISQSEYYRVHNRALAALAAVLGLDSDGGASPAAPAPRERRRPTESGCPFVGRDVELARLFQAFEPVEQGHGGRLVLVRGPVGIGKTRLVEKFGREAVARGGSFCAGRYLRHGAALAPWVTALRAVLLALPLEERVEAIGPFVSYLRVLLPEIREWAGGQPTAEAEGALALSPADRRMLLYDAVASTLASVSGRRPLVLLVDDLQWAPDLSLSLHLAQRLDRSRLLVVGVAREPELRERADLLQEWSDLERLSHATSFVLGPLSERETEQLVSAQFGSSAAAQLGDRLYRVTKGNPFFVGETLRLLVETGSLRDEAGTWRLASQAPVSLPDSARALVLQRADRLGAEGRRLLGQAAVLGFEFQRADLAALSGLDHAALAEQLGAALAAGLLVDRSAAGDERYAFSDDQVQEALYSDLPRPVRQLWHLRAGEHLLSRHGPGADVESLAKHFTAANDLVRGARYSQAAGERAEEVGSWALALRHYRTALLFWERTGEHLAQQADLCRRLGEATYRSVTDVAESIQYLERARRLYAQLGDRPMEGAVMALLGREFMNSGNLALRDMARAFDAMTAARAILETVPPSPPLCDTYFLLASLSAYRLDVAGIIAWGRQSVELARSLGDAPRLLAAESVLGAGLAASGHLAEGRALIEAANRQAEERRLGWLADLSRAHLCWVVLAVDPRTARHVAARAPVHDTLPARMFLPAETAEACARLGDLRAGRDAVEVVRRYAAQPGSSDFTSASGQVGCLLTRCGAWPEAEEVLSRGAAYATRVQDLGHLMIVRLRMAELYRDMDRVSEAEALLTQVAAAFRAGRYVLGLVEALAALAECQVRLERPAEARATLDEARELLDPSEDWGRLSAAVALAEAQWLGAVGKAEAAGGRFGQALASFEQLGLAWDVARACFLWGAAGVDPQSGPLLHRAERAWSDMGVPGYAALARRLVARPS